MKHEILQAIDTFLAMSLRTDNDVVTEQFAYIKARIASPVGDETAHQNQGRKKALSLMNAKSREDIRFLFLEKDSPKPVADKARVLARLQERVSQVRQLIEDNY